jgi:signal peptide peptidase SppA
LKLLDLLTNPWAIQPEKLAEILGIYATHLRGEQIDIKAIEARLGRPLSSEQQEYAVREGGVAVLAIDGVIAPKANLFTQVSGGVSAQMAQLQLESAIADARVKSVVLQIDSPGGSVFGTPELAAAVHELAQVKPIVAVSDGMIASAAYWIGSAANGVFLSGPTVHAGSIGVVMAHEFNPRSQGRVTEISAGKYKRIASEHQPLSEEAKAYLQDRVDHLYAVFVDTVAAHRGVAAAQVLEHMADGRVFVGQQAVDAGLADGFMSVDAAVEALATDPSRYAKRARVATRQPQRAPRAAVPQPTPTPTGASTMDRTQLEADHPALFADLRATFIAEGAAAERARIQAVEGAGLPGHEALINAVKYDGKTTAADAALAIVAAERAQRAAHAAAQAGEAPKPAPAAAAPVQQLGAADPMADATQPIEARCKAKWEGDAAVRAEFASLEDFTAFSKALERGNVRILGKRTA